MERGLTESTEKLGAFLFPYRGMIWGIIGLLVFLFAQVKTTLFVAGLFILIIGEMLRIWGVGYIKNYRGPMAEATELTTAGPYAFVRNPLYLANGIIGTGISLFSGYIFMIPLFFSFFSFCIIQLFVLKNNSLPINLRINTPIINKKCRVTYQFFVPILIPWVVFPGM